MTRGISNQESVLYDSATVGGDGSSSNGEGLHQATNSLEDYFYIDRLDKDQTGTVHLWVKVEGETQGNSYQKTLAKLQMNFAVEKVVASGTTTTRNIVQSVKTGDTNRILLFSALALVSGVFLLFLGFYSMKKRKNNQEGE